LGGAPGRVAARGSVVDRLVVGVGCPMRTDRVPASMGGGPSSVPCFHVAVRSRGRRRGRTLFGCPSQSLGAVELRAVRSGALREKLHYWAEATAAMLPRVGSGVGFGPGRSRGLAGGQYQRLVVGAP